MQKHDEKRNRSEGGRAHCQVVGVFLGEGKEEGIDSTQMELIRRPQLSLKDESRSYLAE